MIKVCKFGGSSLASGEQFKKVKDIVKCDETRCVVVVSAPGRRFEGDSKITDLPCPPEVRRELREHI